MKTIDLTTLLPRFFTEYLVEQRNVSPSTVAAYRDTFRLLLRFIQRSRRSKPAELSLQVLTPSSILAFLAHLENERRNTIRSRNARLAAIRSFLHYASDLLGTELPEATRRVLSIPWKRQIQPLLGFLSREEVQAILVAQSVWNHDCVAPSWPAVNTLTQSAAQTGEATRRCGQKPQECPAVAPSTPAIDLWCPRSPATSATPPQAPQKNDQNHS